MHIALCLALTTLLALLAGVAVPEEEAPMALCEHASKDYSPGAIIVQHGIAIRCGQDRAWSIVGQTTLCHFEGRSYSKGARRAPKMGGGPVQLCHRGEWIRPPEAAGRRRGAGPPPPML